MPLLLEQPQCEWIVLMTLPVLLIQRGHSDLGSLST